MLNGIGGWAGCLVVILIVAIAALPFASHAFLPAFNPAGGTSATT